MDNLYLKPYGDIELKRRMVSDRPRTDAFAAAIREVVQPGDVVLDVGTGGWSVPLVNQITDEHETMFAACLTHRSSLAKLNSDC